MAFPWRSGRRASFALASRAERILRSDLRGKTKTPNFQNKKRRVPLSHRQKNIERFFSENKRRDVKLNQ